jgi:hypothetical protein
MWFIYTWFSIGAFVAIVNFIQWCLDGCLIGEGPEDPYYYLTGMFGNVIGGFVFGPVVIFTQYTHGMPILPQRKR